MNPIHLLSILAQTAPAGEPWPGPLTYVGVGLLILATVIYVLNRRAPPDDNAPSDTQE